jgi:hypothetical protein
MTKKSSLFIFLCIVSTASAQYFSYSTGVKPTLVIRAQFLDIASTLDYSTASRQMDLVSTRLANTSYGKTSLNSTITTKIYRLPHRASYYANIPEWGACDAIARDAFTLAQVQYDLTTFERFVIHFPSLQNQGTEGIATGSKIFFNSGVSHSQWTNFNGSWFVVSFMNGDFGVGLTLHELGHTYFAGHPTSVHTTLGHSSLWQVSDGNPISPDGQISEWGDKYSPMGNLSHSNNTVLDFPPSMKVQLGWMPSSKVLTVTASGTYRVYRFDTLTPSLPVAGPLALKIKKDSNKTYWIGIRRAFTSNASMSNGAYIVWKMPVVNAYMGTRQYSVLLDCSTPGISTEDAALGIGKSLVDVPAGITITPVREGGTAPNQWMDIRIRKY